MQILAIIGAITVFLICVGILMYRAGILEISAEIDKDD